ncbi:MAG: fibronectin type III domain-containing protein, partial [Bacteroidales bacterium]|nr:fibronectin type III domain-containing protein [Bacteroidales bacterium]
MKKQIGFLFAAIFFMLASSFAQNSGCSLSLGYTLGFESSETDAYNCLTIVQVSGSNVHRQSLTDSKTGTGCNKCYEGTYAAEFKGGNAVVILPAYSGSYDKTRFSMYYRQNGTTTQNLGSAGTMEVGYVTSTTDTTTFSSLQVLDEYAGAHCGDFHLAQVSCSDIPDGAYIAIRYTMASSGVSWYLDNFKFEVEPDCPRVTGTLVCTTSDHNSATLSFTDAEEQSSWVLYWKKASDDQYTTVNLTETEYTIPDLDENTAYEAYVTRDCGEFAEWSNVVAFKTTAVAIEVDDELTITFDEDEDANKFVFNDGDGGFHFTVGDKTAQSGNSMYLANSSDEYSYTEGNWAAAELLVKFGDKAEYTLSFDYKINAGTYSTYDERLTVLLCDGTTEVGSTKPNGVELLRGQGKSDWTSFTYILPKGENGVQGKSYKIVFWYQDDDYTDCSSNCIFPAVDNFQIVGSDCAAPTDLVSSNVLTESIDISWTQAGELDGWKVYYKEVGSDDEWNTLDVSGSDPETTIDGLEGDSYYNIKVVGLCGDEETASTNTITVHTACVAITDEPWETGFESGYTLDCWEMVSQTNSSYSGDPFPKLQSNNSSVAYEGNGSIEFKTYNAGTQIVALPLFNYDLTSKRITFKYRTNNSYSYYSVGSFKVGYVTDLNDPESYVNIEELSSTSNGEWKDAEVYLTSIPEGARIALRYKQSSYNRGYTSWYVDNVKVSDLPTCMPVTKTSVSAVNVSESSATITFEDLDESHSSWIVYYRPNGSDAEYTEITATSNEQEITGLSAQTKYDVYVVVDCGGELSDPSNLYSFKTACGSLTENDIPWTATFDDETNNEAPACWIETHPYYSTYNSENHNYPAI